MKGRILPLVGVLSALVLALAIVFRPLPTSITPENAAKVRPGMTYPQVVEILGEMRNEVKGTELPGMADLIEVSGVSISSWRSQSTHVQIRFQSGRVKEVTVSKNEFPSTAAYLNWRVRASLGLPLGEDEE